MNKFITFIKTHKKDFSSVFFVLTILLIGVSLTSHIYIKNTFNSLFLYPLLILLLTIFSGLASFFLYRHSNNHDLNRFFISILLSINSMFLPEITMNSFFIKSNIIYNFLGIILCFIPFLLFSVIFTNTTVLKIFYGITSGFFTLYSVLQYYVIDFRGNPIQFADFSNIDSAMEIKGEYSFIPQIMTVYALINFALILFFIVKCKISPLKIKPRIMGSISLIIMCFILYSGGNFAFNMGIKNRYIRLNFSGEENCETYSYIGYNLMLYFDGMYNRVSKPDGYSDKKAKEILSQYKTETPEKKPTIIAIMNESFADFEHIGKFRTNKDYLPNFHKLQKESISGYVTVSAYGGYSCNSEYEFLSGNTLGFLPSGSAVFTQYLNNKQDSLVSYLNSMDYRTIALSPCTEALWNIGDAYKNLQFKDRFYNCTDMIFNPEEINGNLSDESLYRLVIDKYEERKNSPLFIWTATMQNHGPYDDEEEKKGTVPDEITVENYDTFESKQYLNSIYQSDKALGELTDYFSKVDDEVIIVMFGDHYPHIMDFTEHLYGSNVSTLSVEDYSRLHQTPFIIWSNKGLEQKEIDQISLNYLSDEVLKAAELPLAPYQQELEKVRKELPVISQFGYMNSDGEWFYTNDDDSKTNEIKNEYHTMQYYRMFGKEKK